MSYKAQNGNLTSLAFSGSAAGHDRACRVRPSDDSSISRTTRDMGGLPFYPLDK